MPNLLNRIKEKNWRNRRASGCGTTEGIDRAEMSYSQAFARCGGDFHAGGVDGPIRPKKSPDPQKLPKVFLDVGLTNRLRMNHCYDPEDFDPERTAPDAK
jgi:hypothetical protein